MYKNYTVKEVKKIMSKVEWNPLKPKEQYCRLWLSVMPLEKEFQEPTDIICHVKPHWSCWFFVCCCTDVKKPHSPTGQGPLIIPRHVLSCKGTQYCRFAMQFATETTWTVKQKLDNLLETLTWRLWPCFLPWPWGNDALIWILYLN